MTAEYILPPGAFCSLLEMDPLISVFYSRSHKCYLVKPLTEEDQFTIMMCGGTEMAGRINVEDLLGCMAIWKNIDAMQEKEVNKAIVAANKIRVKANRKTIGTL